MIRLWYCTGREARDIWWLTTTPQWSSILRFKIWRRESRSPSFSLLLFFFEAEFIRGCPNRNSFQPWPNHLLGELPIDVGRNKRQLSFVLFFHHAERLEKTCCERSGAVRVRHSRNEFISLCSLANLEPSKRNFTRPQVIPPLAILMRFDSHKTPPGPCANNIPKLVFLGDCTPIKVTSSSGQGRKCAAHMFRCAAENPN